MHLSFFLIFYKTKIIKNKKDFFYKFIYVYMKIENNVIFFVVIILHTINSKFYEFTVGLRWFIIQTLSRVSIYLEERWFGKIV